jgi:dCTP diphosphatase
VQTGEVGELAELFQWRGEVAPGLPTFSAAEREAVGEELSDVLLYLVRLSDACGIDLGAAACVTCRAGYQQADCGRCGWRMVVLAPCLRWTLPKQCCLLLCCRVAKMGKNRAKYPADLCRGSSRKYTELGGRGAGGGGGRDPP